MRIEMQDVRIPWLGSTEKDPYGSRTHERLDFQQYPLIALALWH